MKISLRLPTFLINKILKQSYYSKLEPVDTIKYALINRTNSKRAQKPICYKYTYYGPHNKLNCELPDEFVARLEQSAKEADLSLNDYVIWMLRKWNPKKKISSLEKRKKIIEKQIEEYETLKELLKKDGD